MSFPTLYAADARLAYARSGGIGLGWVWPTVACARWPGHGAADRYTGPWNRPTAHTILLLGNTGSLPPAGTVCRQDAAPFPAP